VLTDTKLAPALPGGKPALRRPVSIAFLILAHRQPRPFARLCDRLAAGGDGIFAHIDARADLAPFAAAAGARVHFLADRVAADWAGYSLVEATLQLIRAALAHGNADHLSLHSGADYPLRPLAMFRRHLAVHPEVEFIQVDDHASTHPAFRARHEKYWCEPPRTSGKRLLESLRHCWPGRRRFPGGLRPWSGSQWWTLTRPCAAWLADRLEQDRALVHFLRHTLVPDELAFPTLLMASPFRDRIAGDHLRCIEFPPGSPHARTWRAADLPRLLAHPGFFARKFDGDDPERLLDRLDERLGAAAGCAAG
jgi:hypothetical protein